MAHAVVLHVGGTREGIARIFLGLKPGGVEARDVALGIERLLADARRKKQGRGAKHEGMCKMFQEIMGLKNVFAVQRYEKRRAQENISVKALIFTAKITE